MYVFKMAFVATVAAASRLVGQESSGNARPGWNFVGDRAFDTSPRRRLFDFDFLALGEDVGLD